MTEKTRLNLEISQKVTDRIDRLKDTSDASSRTEVIRRSLAVYEKILDHEQNGGMTILRTPEGAEYLLVIVTG